MQFAGITFLDREEDVQRNPVYWAGELSLQLGGEEGSRVLSKKPPCTLENTWTKLLVMIRK